MSVKECYLCFENKKTGALRHEEPLLKLMSLISFVIF